MTSAGKLPPPPFVFVPPLTPFKEDLRVDFPALQREVEFVLETSPSAVISVAAVETQEYQYLSHEQRIDLIRATVESVAGRGATFVGVTHPNLHVSLALAELAASLGAAGIQALVPLRPFGGPPNLDDLLRYFQALGESALPVCVYHNPGPGADPPPAWLIKLAELPHVEFFKESSRDLRRVGYLIEQIEVAGLAHYLTTMQMLAASLCLGGSGATMPPPASALGSRIIEAFRRGDLQEVWKLQKGFRMFPAAWMHKGLAPVMKAAMSIIGVELGEPFPPYEGLTRAERDEVAAHLKRYGLARAALGRSRGKSTAGAESPAKSVPHR